MSNGVNIAPPVQGETPRVSVTIGSESTREVVNVLLKVIRDSEKFGGVLLSQHKIRFANLSADEIVWTSPFGTDSYSVIFAKNGWTYTIEAIQDRDMRDNAILSTFKFIK